jgi:SAM-dependent methyltransferase
VEDLTALRMGPRSYYHDFRDLYWAYWPAAAAYREDLDILVAGCGTMGAAAFAFLYPRARILGIDVSTTSLNHEEYLKNKHGLANLSLQQCRLEDATSLGKDFDFVSVTGVLHHLADPVAGLTALGKVLRPDSVVSILVYGRYPRTGVYMLQELFGLIGLGHSDHDVQTVREVLGSLGPEHPVQPYLRRAARDLSSPHGLVDTFLHKRDRSYTVKECLDLVEGAGLAFQGWEENIFYHADGLGPAPASLRSRLEQLQGSPLWQAMELIHSMQSMHRFYACRKDRDPASYRLDPEGEAFVDYRPVAYVTQATPADPIRRQPASIARPPFPVVTLDDRQAALFAQIDGQRSVRQCLQNIGMQPDRPDDLAFGRGFFGSLWRVGYVLFRLPGEEENSLAQSRKAAKKN